MHKTAKLSLYLIQAFAFLAVFNAAAAEAYVGPGPGLTVLGALWAVIAAVILAVLAIVRWPLRYLLRKYRSKGAEGTGEAGAPDAADASVQEPGPADTEDK